MKVKDLLKRNIVFISLSLVLAIALGLALLCIPKGELHLLICNRHTPARDIFYRYYTQAAEWLPYVICLLILLFGRAGNAALATSCVALSGLTTQIVKHIVNAPRPLTWFAANMPDVQLPLVEGLSMSRYFSFPSGHTTTFFSLFFALSIIITSHLTAKQSNSTSGLTGLTALLQAVLFTLAALGAYSRIYLSQHFAADVLGGIIVGLLISIACYAVFSRFESYKWYNYRLLGKKVH